MDQRTVVVSGKIKHNIGVFPKWNTKSVNSVNSESDKSLRHEFKDLACYLCLAGAVVASRSLTQGVAG